jgi:hypothetical protein
MSEGPEPKPKNVVGRPSKRTPSKAQALCQALSIGMPQYAACLKAGISVSTFSQWRKTDPLFAEQTERAEIEGMHKYLEVIRDCLSSEDEAIRLRTATWALEHRWPQFFARTRLEITGAVEDKVVVLLWPHQQKKAEVVTDEPTNDNPTGTPLLAG